MPNDYKSSGVNIEAGETAVKAIKQMVRTTYNKNVLSDLGSFGGLYQVDLQTWKQPVLVSSADGVGTKLRLAIEAGRFDTVGQDLVNHCVNDILVQGAIPQFFLDYIGVGELNPKQIELIISGFVQACCENGCVLIGGEMAEMPGIYQKGDFDLAGTIIGMVEKSGLITGEAIQPGDVLIGLPSSGLHTNGYSLARKILADNLLTVDSYIGEICQTVADAFLAVHTSYLTLLKPLLTRHSRSTESSVGFQSCENGNPVSSHSRENGNPSSSHSRENGNPSSCHSRENGNPVSGHSRENGNPVSCHSRENGNPSNQTILHGMAHITGGGIPGNLSRIIPDGLIAHINEQAWEMPLLFQWLQDLGNVEQTEMRKVFNCGIGMILAVGKADAPEVLTHTNGILLGEIRPAIPTATGKVSYL